MLLSFSFSNFASFVEKTDLSLRLSTRDPVIGWDRYALTGQRASTVVAIVGANGAGKSSVLKAGSFLAWFIRESFAADPEALLPFHPHMLHTKEPSRFELELVDDDGTQWFYSLVTTTTQVHQETLRKRPLAGNVRSVFTRVWNSKARSYVVSQPGVERRLPPSEAAKVRPNASFISAARQYGVDVASGLQSFRITSNLKSREGGSEWTALTEAADHFHQAPESMNKARQLLTQLDLGLSNVELVAMETTTTPSPNVGGSPQRPTYYPLGIHSSSTNVFHLPFAWESAGTRTAFVLLRHLLDALATGTPALIDEFDATLHPHMVEPILRLFDREETNPHGAQLVFTVQSPEVLSLLKPAQVLFVEKTACMSTAYRGDEIRGLKSNDNLYGKYMAGALGAVPQL